MTRDIFRNNYIPGVWNVQCDRTGFKFKSTECQEEWTGLFVNTDSWEPRHPQDEIRGRSDDQTVPTLRPIVLTKFLSATEVSADDL